MHIRVKKRAREKERMNRENNYTTTTIKIASSSTEKKEEERKQLRRRDIDSGHNNKNALSIADLSSAWDIEFVPYPHNLVFNTLTLSCLDIFLTAL